jgi:uncharacterized membrane protein HdeD (DUF308 family)
MYLFSYFIYLFIYLLFILFFTMDEFMISYELILIVLFSKIEAPAFALAQPFNRQRTIS